MEIFHPIWHCAPTSPSRRGIAAVFLVSLLAATNPATAQDGSGSRIAAGFARPALAALGGAAGETEAVIGALCEEPSQAALKTARETFGTLVAAWGRVTVLRFGPLADEHRFERIFFWPDPRGIALRQVQGLLAEKDESATTAAGLSEKSAALQGLPALEFALFGTGAEEMAAKPDSFRCNYARAIAGNVSAIAGDTLAGWQDGGAFAQSFTGPGAGTEPYRTAAEVDGEIVKALSTVFQFVHAAELEPPLGDAIDDARGKRAPLWRSGLTFDLVAAQVEGAHDFLDFAGYEETLPEDRRWVAGSIRFELQTALTALSGIDAPPEQAFGEEAARGKINLANLAIEHAGRQVSEQLAGALGLVMGFNALDGD
jgi:predicted lipoprotein